MTGDYSHIARCTDLGEDDASTAVRARASARQLLEHLVTLCASADDATRVLWVLALLATEDASEWVDGRLEVELVDAGDETIVETVTSIGGGLRERLLPRLTLKAHLADLVSAIERTPECIEPLYVWHGSGGRVKLVPDAAAPRSVRPRPPIAIAGDSLVESIPPLPPDGVVGGSERPLPPMREPRSPLEELDDPLSDLEHGWDN
jgi:hypothetical protein